MLPGSGVAAPEVPRIWKVSESVPGSMLFATLPMVFSHAVDGPSFISQKSGLHWVVVAFES